MIPEQKLDLWIEKHYNVMLIGRHGVGKTSIVLDKWQKAGLNYLYFSAATMDPWIDLVGVPREKHDPQTGQDYIELVPPKDLALDNIDAIFFDEYNRAPEKVRNATMQFIQLKAVNGRQYKRLKMIWAAINPDENDEYDVAKLDPAQQDRFQVQYKVPFRPDKKYFEDVYGPQGIKFVDWWHKLPDKIKNNLSPRRLDYAARIFFDGGDLEDVLPEGVNFTELRQNLNHGTIQQRVARLRNNKNTTAEDIRKFVQNENNWYHLKTEVLKDDGLFQYFSPHFEPEKVLALCNEQMRLADKFVYFAGDNVDTVEHLKQYWDKKGVIPTLMTGCLIRNFKYPEVTNHVNDESKQKQLMEALGNQIEQNPTANQVYGAAWVLEKAVKDWPKLESQGYVREYREKVRKAAGAYPKIQKVFAEALK